MRNLKSIACIAVLGMGLQPAIANEENQPAAESPAEETPAETDIERIRSEFEELLIRQATDFSSPTATLSTMSNLANKHLRADERFNQPIREVLTRYASDQNEKDLDGDDLALAVTMFELTTFPPDVAAELLVKTMLSEHPAIKRVTRHRIRSLLRERPDAVSVVVLDVLRRGEWSPYVIELAGIAGEGSEAVAAELLRIAKSGDAAQTPAVLQSLAVAIDAVERYRFNQREQTGLESGIESRFLEYARRIVQRNDRDGDGKLSKKEYESMIMRPEPADANDDGVITVAEYADWMTKRSNR